MAETKKKTKNSESTEEMQTATAFPEETVENEESLQSDGKTEENPESSESVKTEEAEKNATSNDSLISEEDQESNDIMEKLRQESETMQDSKIIDDAGADVMEEVEEEETKKIDDFDEARTFEKRRIHMASKAEQKKLYEEKHDIAYFPGMEAKTEMQQREEEVKILRNAARSIPPTILTGTIVGIENTPNGYSMAQVTTKGTAGEIMVKIPVSHLFLFNPRDYEGEEGETYLQNELISRINSEIHFLVYDVKEEDGFAYGSRIAAMDLEGRMNYIRPRGDGLPRVCEGMISEARVLSVRKDRVRVEVAGIETTIKSGRELSWTALSDLRDEFQIGQKFMVKILKVAAEKRTIGNKEYNLIHIEVSKSKAETNPAEKYYHQFKVGQVVAGLIKTEATDAGVFVTIQGKMDVLCSIPPTGHVEQGKICTVRIMKCDDAKKQLTGRIINMER